MAPSKESAGNGLTLGIVGCGKMGGAVLAGILAAVAKAEEAGTLEDVPLTSFIVSVHTQGSADKLAETFSAHSDRITITLDNLAVFSKADILMLGCKPYQAQEVLGSKGVKEAVKGKLLISLLAGSPPAKLENFIYGPDDSTPAAERCRANRTCPNMSAEVGQSMTIIENSYPPLSEKFNEITYWIFEQCGKARGVEPANFDASSALSGTAIAFLTIAFDGLLDGGVYEGVKRTDGQAMLAQTMRGLAALMEGGQSGATLRENSSSPRGTTIRGLLKLEKAAVRAAFCEAVIESADRARNM